MGIAGNVSINVIPDPPPTVNITSPPQGASLMEGSRITITADATDNIAVQSVVFAINGVEQPALTGSPYTMPFTIPLGVTEVTLSVIATDNLWRSTIDTHIVPVIPDPPPTVNITSPPQGVPLMEGSRITITADVTDDVYVESMDVTINGTPYYSRMFTVPLGVKEVTVSVTATDNLGKSTTDTRVFAVIPDPLTTVVGTVVDSNSAPVGGATVVTRNNLSGVTDASGAFTIHGVPTIFDKIRVNAMATVSRSRISGISNNVSPAVDGITNVGKIVLTPIIRYPGQKFISNHVGMVAVADLDNDGITDIVTGNNNNGVSVLLGNGDGTFQTTWEFEMYYGPHSVAVADINTDGVPDILTANQYSDSFVYSGGVSLFLGNGDGTFELRQILAVGMGRRSVAVADLNADDFPDIVTANYFSNVSVFFGSGNGTFQPEQRFALGVYPYSVAVADFNADNRPDIVTANSSSNNVSVLFNNGNGTFHAEQRFAVGSGPQSVAIAEFNADSRPDIVTANLNSDDVSVLLGNGDGTFHAQQRLVAGDNPFSLAVSDLNTDGYPDIVTANQGSSPSYYSSSVSVFLGNGNGSFQSQKHFLTSSESRSVAVADLDADGASDIVTTAGNFTPSYHVLVFFGNGDGTFQAQKRFSVGASPRSVAVADLNADNAPDIVTANANSGDISMLLGNGDGTFQAGQSFTVGSGPQSVSVADLNADNAPDIVTANASSGDISVLLGNGNGTFQTQQRFAEGTYPFLISVADLNADGSPDIVTNNSVFLGNRNGTFQTQQPLDMDSYLTSVLVVDLNADAKLDIITTNVYFNHISLMLGNGDGTFKPRQIFTVGFEPQSVSVADLNADGRPDIVTANESSNDISVLLRQ